MVYLALARKSNSSYAAYLTAAREVKYNGARPVPCICATPVRSCKRNGATARNTNIPTTTLTAGWNRITCPPSSVGRRFYQPRDMGDEARLSQWWRKIHKIRKTEES